jgi:lipopolysaccharide transport protein LptA
MKGLAAWIVLIVGCAAAPRLHGEIAAASPKTAATASDKKAKKTTIETTPAEKKSKKAEKEKTSSSANPFSQAAAGLQSNEPVTTQIYADEAFFDSTKNMGIFSGRVKVIDPRFNLQSDKLTVFISKGQNQGLEKAIADGNVGLVRDRPDPKGGAPTRAVGRADKATYMAATGDVELRGTPRVQEGLNMHVATSPDTVMVINQNSQLTTHGPSRTEIRQPAAEEKKDKSSPTPQNSAAQTPPPATLPKP